MKIIRVYLKILSFLEVKFSIYLNRLLFVMLFNHDVLIFFFLFIYFFFWGGGGGGAVYDPFKNISLNYIELIVHQRWVKTGEPGGKKHLTIHK